MIRAGRAHDYRRFRKQISGAVLDSPSRHRKVVRIHFGADAVPAPSSGRYVRRAGTHEWIEHRIPDETEHSNEAFREL
jgi:hypothetical protein